MAYGWHLIFFSVHLKVDLWPLGIEAQFVVGGGGVDRACTLLVYLLIPVSDLCSSSVNLAHKE